MGSPIPAILDRLENGCGKRVFTSRQDARSACRRIHNKYRLYRCRACRWLWHITHAERR